jgi:molybdopterin/thiamine biosynthesis adenylyltransferase
MIDIEVRLTEEQTSQLIALTCADENEAAAIALCGRSVVQDPWTGRQIERLHLREIIEIPVEAYEGRSPATFTWSTTPFFQALKRAEAADFGVAFIHSHPPGELAFSKADDVADNDLFSIAFNRLESRRPHVSVILNRASEIVARGYGPDLKPIPSRIMEIGERWKVFGAEAAPAAPELDRQTRVFGEVSTADLSRLRVGIVGCGGTGSAVASLLARVGIRNVALIDADYVDDTNLNRLHFSSRVDASLRRAKVDVVGEGMAAIGLPMSIVRVRSFINAPEAIEALKACDVIFGCTDDHLGRETLNRIAHFYYIPVIDLGLLIEHGDDGGYDTFDGRVTIVQPGYPCQQCRGLIDPGEMYTDSLRLDPALMQMNRRAGYVPDDPAPNPVVVTFTTEVATMAVNELFHRLTGYRGTVERCSERVRRFDVLKCSDTLPGGMSKPSCKICGKRQYDGRGDVNPKLGLVL